MKKLYSLPLLGFMMVFTVLVNSCSNEESIAASFEYENHDFEFYYQELMTMPGISILDVTDSDGDTRGETLGFPCVTQDDLEYLSNLNQSEFENLRDSLIIRAGGIEVLDSLEVANYMSLYMEITHNGNDIVKMQELKEFCIDYLLNSDGGFTLTRSMQEEASTAELKVYAQQAAFIDKVSRPIYEHISKESLQIVSEQRKGDKLICLEELGFKLALAGVKIGVGAFLDAMSGGIGTEGLILELLSVGVDAVDMWYSYEVCNGRWH